MAAGDLTYRLDAHEIITYRRADIYAQVWTEPIRNVARRQCVPDAELPAVRAWIMSCEVAWLPCASKADAIELETRLKAEFRPGLTGR